MMVSNEREELQMIIQLLHNHYDEDKLQYVIKEMKTLGQPTIKVVWDDMNGQWQALEGCHRLRACELLEIEPILEDVSDEEVAIIELDGEDTEVNPTELMLELQGINLKAIKF